MTGKIMVFGGTSGVGLQTATNLSQKGFVVHATGRNADKIARLRDQYPSIQFHVADSAAEGAVEACLQKIGSLDHAIMALGGAKGAGPLKDLQISALSEGFADKLLSQLRSLKALLPHLHKTGSVTFISAVSAQMAAPGTVGLAAINGAIEAMIKPLAAELAPLRINAVSPGVIDTPWWNWLPEDQRSAVMQQYAGAALVQRVGAAQDIALAIEFLITNSFCTGTVITCDGGLRLKAGG
jgi:NAD(P)-dependent dehydrogenase (short-subunit alcohol dehydrogenase family)